MTHREKLNHLVADLRLRGIATTFATPGVYRVLWKLGFNVPPPVFAPVTAGLIGMVSFTFLWGLPFWLLFNLLPGKSIPYQLAIIVFVCPAILVGTMAATSCGSMAARLRLGTWDRYPDN
jgi:hypothetical protein